MIERTGNPAGVKNSATYSITVDEGPERSPGGEGAGGDAGLRVQDFEAAVFDLDGVVTRTARVHAESWKRLFDEYLRQRAENTGEPFEPFDIQRDYGRYVDGKPRYEGVESFLRSRGISLAHGDPSDPPERETVCGLGNRKNGYFHDSLQQNGVEVYDGTVAFIRRLRDRHVRTALVSSSRNARAVLKAAGLTDLFDALIDGNDIIRLGLRGKPEPDLFVKAADKVGVEPEHAVVVEDAISGVQAGRAGGFGLVIGVDRQNRTAELRKNGADIVVKDVADLHIRFRASAPCRAAPQVERALDHYAEIEKQLGGRRAAVFLDYDGTLTPIVERPELAVLSQEMRTAVRDLARVCTVAVVSGRDRRDVERLVGLDELVYAGSHGFDIAGPDGLRLQHDEGAAFADDVERAARRLRQELAPVKAALVDPKRFAVAVHFRQVANEDLPAVERAVDRVLEEFPRLRKTFGKKILELRPRLDWDKGKAVLWLLDALGLGDSDVLPFYFGDDVTDEDAFRALRGRGVGILVGCPERETAAPYVLDRPSEVGRFLVRLRDTLEKRGNG